MKKPKILVLDIETAPIEMYAWNIYGENTGLPMMKTDWSILSYTAKWHGAKSYIYRDTSKQKNLRDDKAMLKRIWELMDEADIILTQNGKKFDEKKLNARFIINGYPPPSSYLHIDTKQMANKRFGFTSAGLEYMTDVLGVKYKKLKHKRFPGFELWRECLARNSAAWAEMKAYNVRDVLALECLYNKLKAWGNQVNMSVFNTTPVFSCRHCGSTDLHKRGFGFSSVGKYRKYQCKSCGGWTSESGAKNNLLSKEKRAALKGGAK